MRWIRPARLRPGGIVLVVALGVLALAPARSCWRRYRPESRAELVGMGRSDAEGVAAELMHRGVDVRIERLIDLTAEPGVERFSLRYPLSCERRVQRHLADLLVSPVARLA